MEHYNSVLEITFHFWEYINGNQTFILDSHRPFVCSADRRDRTVKHPSFCIGILPVLSGEDVPGHDEPGPRPRHLRHLRAGEGLQGTEARDL
jgi:hypothetical protein